MHREIAAAVDARAGSGGGHLAGARGGGAEGAVEAPGGPAQQSAAEMAAALDATPEGGVRAEAPRAAAAAASRGPRAQLPRPRRSAGCRRRPDAPPRAPEPTIVDTATAIMRRHDAAAAAAACGNAAGNGRCRPATDARRALAGAAARRLPGAAPAARAAASCSIAALAAVVGGALACVVIAIVLGVVRHRAARARGDGRRRGPRRRRPRLRRRAGPSSARRTSPAAPGAPSGAAVRVEEARRLRHNGEWEQALAVLHQARRETPRRRRRRLPAGRHLPRAPPAARRASPPRKARFAKIPRCKSDGDLVNAVIESLASDKTYDRSQAFLRGLGPAATPFLKEAAQHNPSAKVRERAARGPAGCRWAKVGIWVEPALVVKPFP